jgi:ATP-dependent RNA helicase RhlE
MEVPYKVVLLFLNIPRPKITYMTFKDTGLNAELLKVIEACGFENPTPIQAQSIPQILSGKDVIGSAQTGTGKTAAFALPILHLLNDGPFNEKVRCLVIGPTRELAAQIKEQFVLFGSKSPSKVCLLHGGVPYKAQNEALSSGVDIIAATPGRLLDHVKNKTIDLSDVEYLVMDEVDRMLDMGFIEDVTKIIRKCTNKNRQTLLFSATVSDSIKRIIANNLKDPVEINIGIQLSPASTVKHEVYPIGALQKFDLLIALMENMKEGSTIIFCRMKDGADRVARWLKEREFNCTVMHSNLSQKLREESLRDFKSGAAQILVATDIASRGLDIASVTHVVNYDVPEHSEDYVHRIGRTGRAQKEGDAATLVALDEMSHLDSIEKLIGMHIPQRRLEGFNYIQEPIIREMPSENQPRRRRNSRSSQFGRRRKA